MSKAKNDKFIYNPEPPRRFGADEDRDVFLQNFLEEKEKSNGDFNKITQGDSEVEVLSIDKPNIEE